MCNVLHCRVPSLQPKTNIDLPRYHSKRKSYTKIFASNSQPTISLLTNLRHSKMSFWNEIVPQMFLEQLSNRNDIILSSKNVDNVTRNTYSHVNGKNTWILASVCIALFVLTLVLTIQYFKIRQEISKLIRQNSISSGERILNGTQIWDLKRLNFKQLKTYFLSWCIMIYIVQTYGKGDVNTDAI